MTINATLFPSYSFLGITLYVMYRPSILIMSGFSIHGLHPLLTPSSLTTAHHPPPTLSLYVPPDFILNTEEAATN